MNDFGNISSFDLRDKVSWGLGTEIEVQKKG